MATMNQPSATERSRAEQAVEGLRNERAETIRALAGLTEEDTQLRIDWRGNPQSVNLRLQAFTGHLIDHQQHLLKLLYARGRGVSTAEFMLMKAAGQMAEFEALCLILSDDDFQAAGPNEGDWSAAQILEHVANTERGYRERILSGLETLRSAGGTPA